MKNNHIIEFGIKVKNLRIEKNISQAELAKKCGYNSHSTIAKIEAGLIDLPHSKIESLAEALDTNPSYLMGWTDDPSKDYVQPKKFNIPEQYLDVHVHFSGGIEDLTQSDIDSVIEFIEFTKNLKKN